jgi:hypothetical protein
MDVLCTADVCPVILNATCVFYEANTLIYTGITTNDSVQTALQKIDAKFGDAMVGYTFTNGVFQSVAGAPVGLGGSLTANTSIGGNFTLTFTGNVKATKLVTTGGTASQFVKGDGTLDSTAYQAAGNYITALTGDVIAAGPGSVNASLAVVNSNPGTYGSSTRIPIVTVDTKGRVTALTTTAVSVPSGILSFVGDVYGSGVTGSATTLTLSNVNTNVYTNNTFLKFKVNAKGLVTGATPVTNLDVEAVLGYVPTPETRKLSINGVQYDLQSDVYWTIATGVSSVTATAPLVSSGGATPNISIPKADATNDGYLDNVDWVTFNSKQAALNGTGLVRMSGTTVSYDNTLYTPQSRTLTINGVTFDLSANRSWSIDSMIYPGAGIAVSTGTGWGTSLVDNSTNWNTAYTERISSASAPLSIASNVISISQASGSSNGYLSSSDWTTFNNKEGSITPGTTLQYWRGDKSWHALDTTAVVEGTNLYYTDGRVRLALSVSTPLTYNNTTGQFGIQVANTSQSGYLTSTDWNTFNNKQPAAHYITDLTGEATGAGPGIATVTLSTPAVTGKLLTGVNITGGTVLDTDSILIGIGKLQNQINGLIGGSIYEGVWDAATNTPTLVSSVGTDGHYYIVNVAGNTNLNGITNWNVGDWAIFHGGVWQKVDNTDAVISVNGYTGAVSLVSSDIPEGATNLYFTNTRARQAISLTTTGSSGAATYNDGTGVLNIPNYNPDLSGYVPTSRTLTINGTPFDLTANRSWSVGTVTSVAELTLGTTGTDITSSVATGTTTPVITLNIPTASAANRGALSSADWTTFNSKQAALSGTGFVKISGTTISYDNSTYALDSSVVKLTGNQTVAGIKTFTTGIIADVTTGGTQGFASTNSSASGSSIFLQNNSTVIGNAIGINNTSTADGISIGNEVSGRGIYISNATISGSGKGISIDNYNGGIGIEVGSDSTADAIKILHLSGRGLNIQSSGAGYGLIINNTTASTSAPFTIQKQGVNRITFTDAGAANFTGQLTLGSTITNGTFTYTLPGATGTLALVGGAGVGTVTSVAALTLGTTGTDLSSTVANGTTTPVITLNVPTASAANRGALSAADWTTFNNKASTASLANYLPLAGGTLSGNLLFSDSGTTKRGILGTVGTNDFWFIGGGATAENAGFLEISTGDDGQTAGSSEPIYVRQYGPGNPLTGTLVRTATLLDASGNTSFPGTVTAPTFSGALSGTASGNVVSRGQSNWNDSTVIGNVVGMLSWKNYGNGHVIFDASAGTSPSGGAVNATNSNTAWTSSYPTLMGWNGSSTYGVRVDTARYADSAGSATDSTKLPLAGGTMTGNITYSNGRKGIVGLYNPAQTQAIFAMGPAYVLTDGGASSNIGDFYGLGWSYNPDYGGAGNNPQSKAGLEHQLLLMNAGVTLTALGRGIWTVGNVTAAGATFSGTVTAPTFSGNATTATTASNSTSLGGFASGTYIGKFGNGNGYYQVDNWVQMNGNFGIFWPAQYGLHLYPNNQGSYGSLGVLGDKNGWAGAHFGGATGMTLMMNETEFGFHRQATGWYARFTNGRFYGTSDNTVSISSATGSGYNWTGIQYFVSNRNTPTDSPPLQAYSNNGSGAIMSFHRGGYYAVNFGLDSDNVMRIGGWSAGVNRWQLDMSGNQTVAGNVTASSDVYSNNGWFYSNNNTGWYNNSYGQGIRPAKANVTYGSIINLGENFNGYGGYAITNNYNTIFMQNSGGDHGFFRDGGGGGWSFFYHQNYNCAGIGTDATDPSYSLHIIKYGGSNTGWIIWSDRRIKENIKTIDNALDKVLSLRGVYYNKIDDPNKERCVGYIAQEVLEVVPELVVYSEELDMYNMNYAPMVGMLTEAIKEQQAQIEELKQQVQLLLNR